MLAVTSNRRQVELELGMGQLTVYACASLVSVRRGSCKRKTLVITSRAFSLFETVTLSDYLFSRSVQAGRGSHHVLPRR